MAHVGKIIIIIGIAMLTPVICSIYFKEPVALRLLIAAVITISSGGLLQFICRNQEDLNYREGFAVVTFGWLAACGFSTLPFWLSGYFLSFTDAFFEAVSGITTTGASILTDIEALPKSLLFWRSLTQWLGGMGIMALFVAIIVGMGVRANQIFKAEVPGPVSDKISPRIRETARILWLTYVVISVILLVLLYLFGMNIFDAFCHTFSTMATGGFSTRNQSIGYYNAQIQWIIIIFMFIAGVNFSLHYLAYTKRSLVGYFKNKEFNLYLILTVIAAFLVFVGLNQYTEIGERIRTTLFQVISILTTTGYATSDYTKWSAIGQTIILVLMFIGGSAGSTAGNIKVGRYLIMFQRAKIELKSMLHPKAMMPVRFEGKVLSNGLVLNVLQFFIFF